MYLFFDTETNGLPRNWRAPLSDLNNWPRLVQLAWQLYDGQGNLLGAGDRIIRPEGFTIPVQASSIHGITTERALREGIALTDALGEFRDQLAGAQYLVAHNMSFDEKIVGAEFLRTTRNNPLEGRRKLCTMERTTDFCAIPGNYGYKWPKLSELHVRLFGEDFEEAHNAAADIGATAKCFWELKRRGIL